ncbi:MAG: hypothetical protein WAM42_09610 [Candidatus Nitrosopolaris sp.]
MYLNEFKKGICFQHRGYCSSNSTVFVRSISRKHASTSLPGFGGFHRGFGLHHFGFGLHHFGLF